MTIAIFHDISISTDRWPVDSPHKKPVTRKMFPFDDVTMTSHNNMTSHSATPYALSHIVAAHQNTRLFIIKMHLKMSSVKMAVILSRGRWVNGFMGSVYPHYSRLMHWNWSKHCLSVSEINLGVWVKSTASYPQQRDYQTSTTTTTPHNKTQTMCTVLGMNISSNITAIQCLNCHERSWNHNGLFY